MSFVRDFAMAGNCGENAMNNFLTNVDKSTSQLDLWQRDFQAFEEQGKQFNIPQSFEQGFMYPEMHGAEFDEFDDFERVWENPRPMHEFGVEDFGEFAEVNPILNNLLHDFLNFSATNKVLPPKQIQAQEVQLSNQEVDKLVERSGAIARHFCVTQHNYNLMARQLNNLFQSLNIPVDPRELLNTFIKKEIGQSMGDWEREFQNFREPQINERHFQQFNGVWDNTERNMQRANEWRDEYQTKWNDYKPPEITTEEEETFNKAYNSNQWVDEFQKEEEENERAEEEAWFSKFVSPQAKNSVNQGWAGEYNGRSNTGNAWVDEFHNNAEQNEFDSLTDSLNEIPMEKLQKSNFVKFVNQVKNKEVVLPDLQMKVMEN